MDVTQNLSGFLAASGISTGVLFWWAQIWRMVDETYHDAEQSTMTATVGTISCYLGALACLGALTVAVSTVLRGSPNISVVSAGLFLFGLVVIILQLMLSIWKLCTRLWSKERRGPMDWYVKKLEVNWIRYTIVAGSLAFAVLIIVFTFIGSLAA
jgi:hypothetical protein